MSKIIAIVGPTGVGKSAIAQKLALHRGASILSADSMQVYRGMDIGTAKVRPCEQLVPHFGIDLVDPTHSYSAAEYQAYARHIIECETLQREGTAPIVCGGTGLYLRAALDDFTFPEQAQNEEQSIPQLNEIRQRYEVHYAQLITEYGADNPESSTRVAQEIHGILAQRDAQAAALIHPNNLRRTIRALELNAAGQSYADIKQAFKKRKGYYPTHWIGINCNRELLYHRIDQRVDAMIAQGLLEEVRGLLSAGYRQALTATQAIGYKELVPAIEKDEDLDTAVAAIKQATRRYAKRQLSWFRSDPRVQWVLYDEYVADNITARVTALIDKA